VKVQNIIQTIPLDKLIANPLNANRMNERTFKKLLRNIRRTGRYEPIVVRRHPKIDGSFEIINGHHRVCALKELGYGSAECVVWEVDDKEAALLLATLNRLSGSDVLDKKVELLSRLRGEFSAGELAGLLPQTKVQIEALINLRRPILPAVPDKTASGGLATPLVFYVTVEQLKIISEALSAAIEKVEGDRAARRKANALTLMAEEWMGSNIKNKK
jgi:ParB-like chromosome segregation protein Spo0J